MRRLLFIGLLISMILLVSCTAPSGQVIPAEKFCLSGSDCVASACCHPSDSVNLEFAPNCTGIVCSQDCEPDTLDCGQGVTQCINNSCSAVISELSE